MTSGSMTLQSLIDAFIKQLINPLVPLLIGFALVLFFWGLVKYLRAGFGEKGKLDEAKQLMIWGVISLFVMLSVWGFVKILQTTFFGGSAPATPPNIPLMNRTGNSDIPMDQWFGGVNND